MATIVMKHPKIDDFHNGIKPMPKLFRVVSVELDVLRIGFGSDYGVIFDCDATVVRLVRRVKHRDGWCWQLVREYKDQEEWDYCFESDRECLNNLNWELGLFY
ncbi:MULTISPECIES: hypothetical protein [Providencia]|uniref:hypothetical protein n=1 Tax=Providencia TaxID=586 RepID=UPI001E337611|nr:MULTISPECIES: hypothetical protein [Providencia]MDB9567831.1 hypothetical protein [Providencia rettgeri]URR22889.1 hypothetical protein L3Q80_00080 [Providencia rettgeri]